MSAEVEAMARIWEELERLPVAARKRVLEWTIARQLNTGWYRLPEFPEEQRVCACGERIREDGRCPRGHYAKGLVHAS